MVEVWLAYRRRADCDQPKGRRTPQRGGSERSEGCGKAAQNRIKELKADLGLDAFNMRDFWATEAALGFAMLAYNLMSLFRQAVLRSRIQHTLSTLHGLVLAIGASWHQGSSQNKLMLSVPRRKCAWFAGLWATASAPPVIHGAQSALMDNLG